MFPAVFLHQFPGNHDLMAAALAFQTKIRSDAENLPLAAAAGVCFFELNDHANFEIHGNTSGK